MRVEFNNVKVSTSCKKPKAHMVLRRRRRLSNYLAIFQSRRRAERLL